MDGWNETLKKIGSEMREQEQERQRSYEAQEEKQRQQKTAIEKWFHEELDPAFTELIGELKKAGINTQRRQETGPLTRYVWSLDACGFTYTVRLERGGEDIRGELHFDLPGVLKRIPTLPPEDSGAPQSGKKRVLDWKKKEIKEDFQKRFVAWYEARQATK